MGLVWFCPPFSSAWFYLSSEAARIAVRAAWSSYRLLLLMDIFRGSRSEFAAGQIAPGRNPAESRSNRRAVTRKRPPPGTSAIACPARLSSCCSRTRSHIDPSSESAVAAIVPIADRTRSWWRILVQWRTRFRQSNCRIYAVTPPP